MDKIHDAGYGFSSSAMSNNASPALASLVISDELGTWLIAESDGLLAH
jgi:hypothetical protein